jgi:hypothetical protein
VYPELVIRHDTGKIQDVRYDELAPMLLNDVQEQQRQIDSQAEEIRVLNQQRKLYATEAELRDLRQQLQAASTKSRQSGLLAKR